MRPTRSGGWWQEGSKLDSLDKRCSRVVFELCFPSWGELLMSIPGAYMGFPQAFLGPTPLVVAALTHVSLGAQPPLLLLKAAVAALAAGAAAFYGSLAGYFPAKEAAMATIALMTPFSCGALAQLCTLPAAKAAGYQSLSSAMFACAVCIPLKAGFHRLRPAVALGFINEVKRRRSRLFIPYIKGMCAGGQRLDALPSADVAIAGASAALLWQAGFPVLACGMVAGSAFGRMYLWAHHFLDVVAGCSIGVASTLLLQRIGWGGSLRHVLYTYLVFIASVVVLSKRMQRLEKQEAIAAAEAAAATAAAVAAAAEQCASRNASRKSTASKGEPPSRQASNQERSNSSGTP